MIWCEKSSKSPEPLKKIQQTREKNDRRGGAGTTMFTTTVRSQRGSGPKIAVNV
jgi:hypothetical protein